MSEVKFGGLQDGVYCCEHVFRRERSVLLVMHHVDGDWQFLCGGEDHGELPSHVHLDHLLRSDPTLQQLADLPPGWESERQDKNSDWLRTRSGVVDG